MDIAIRGFVKAMLLSGGDGNSYGNLATALTDWALALSRDQTAAGPVSQAAVLPVLQVANAATDVALLLSPYNPHLLSELKRLKMVGVSLLPQDCTQKGCGTRFPAEDGASKVLGRQERAVSRALEGILTHHWGADGPSVADSNRYLLLGPVSKLCNDPAMLKVTVHRPDPRGASSDGFDSISRRPYWVRWLASQRRALTILRVCGAVVLDGVLPDPLTNHVLAELEPVQQSLTEHYEGCEGQRNCSWEMVYNPVTPGARRYHGRVPLRPPFTDSALIWPDTLKEVLVSGFNGNRQLEIGRFSYVTSLPGIPESGTPGSADYVKAVPAIEQNWHKDVDEPYKNFAGAAAFEEAQKFAPASEDKIASSLPLPQVSPGALVFFALHDVPLRMGPTEMTAGSHLFSAAELQRVGVFEHKMALRQGDIMVMDVRINHSAWFYWISWISGSPGSDGSVIPWRSLTDCVLSCCLHTDPHAAPRHGKPDGFTAYLPLPPVRAGLLYRPRELPGQADETVGRTSIGE